MALNGPLLRVAADRSTREHAGAAGLRLRSSESTKENAVPQLVPLYRALGGIDARIAETLAKATTLDLVDLSDAVCKCNWLGVMRLTGVQRSDDRRPVVAQPIHRGVGG